MAVLPDTRARRQRSLELWQESLQLMPDGVPADGQHWAPYPIFFDRAAGARMWDVDGNEYLDFICGNGAIILGHRPPAVVEAVAEFMSTRWVPNLTPNPYTLELARLINGYIPSLQKIRLVPSASEAVHMALRTARAYTGRRKVGKVEGAFHGQMVEALVSQWPTPGRRGARTRPVPLPNSAGLNAGAIEDTVLIPWNDSEAAVAIIEAHAHELACLIVEPVLGVGGALPADQAFIETLRAVTRRHEIVLIFDETVTGFRYHMGGSQRTYGITPDMTILGKVIGGGFPLAAFGGSDEVMSVVGRAGGKSLLTQIYQSGTFSGFAVGCVAGSATLRALADGSVHAHISRLGEMARQGLRDLTAAVNVPTQVTGVGPMFNLFFTGHPVKDVRDGEDAEPGRRVGTEVHSRLLDKGVRALRNHYSLMCAAHTEADVTQFLTAVEAVLREMRSEGKV